MLRSGLIFAIFVASAATAHAAPADQLDFSRSDHQLHATVAYGATLSTHLLLKEVGAPIPQFFAAGLVMLVGYIKEETDNAYSQGNMAANAVGVTSATFFTITFDL
jgi:hypothetical protein